MSIPNFIDKIKGKIKIDKMTFLYLCIIVGVGVSSFGLGRLSVSFKENIDQEDSIYIKDYTSVSNDSIINNDKLSSIDTKEKKYVASKNGKMYYSIDCSGRSRIKKENEVWFSTREEAEKSGYEISTLCK